MPPFVFVLGHKHTPSHGGAIKEDYDRRTGPVRLPTGVSEKSGSNYRITYLQPLLSRNTLTPTTPTHSYVQNGRILVFVEHARYGWNPCLCLRLLYIYVCAPLCLLLPLSHYWWLRPGVHTYLSQPGQREARLMNIHVGKLAHFTAEGEKEGDRRGLRSAPMRVNAGPTLQTVAQHWTGFAACWEAVALQEWNLSWRPIGTGDRLGTMAAVRRGGGGGRGEVCTERRRREGGRGAVPALGMVSQGGEGVCRVSAACHGHLPACCVCPPHSAAAHCWPDVADVGPTVCRCRVVHIAPYVVKSSHPRRWTRPAALQTMYLQGFGLITHHVHPSLPKCTHTMSDRGYRPYLI